MKKHLVSLIPELLQPTFRKIYYFPIDIIDRLKGRDSMIPPKSMSFVGSGDFEQTGQEFKEYFIRLAKLQPENTVLDVGCGIGRMAVPLTSYLSSGGEYWGFDIVKKGIDWCQNRITGKYGNFHFLHSDVYNKHYNSKGKILAQDYKFPFEDSYFNFVFLTSVLTHMLPSDLENYLSETSRVLKTGGKCLITYFILNDESHGLIRAGRSTLNFSHKIEACLTTNLKDPEAAIAYDEAFIEKLYKKYSLRIIQPVHYGSWCSRDAFLSYQDLIIAEKVEPI
jgi:ubiquinone/menaquinone biosynthesis C-methylase UbiE